MLEGSMRLQKTGIKGLWLIDVLTVQSDKVSLNRYYSQS